MGCGNCSGSAGCGKSGGCASGSCNRMNTYNWLSEVPISDIDTPFPIIEISFNQGSRKDFYSNTKNLEIQKGDRVVVEGTGGYDIGEVSLTGEIVKLQIRKKNARVNTHSAPKVLRLPSEEDIANFNRSKAREKETLIRSREIIKRLGLAMKLAEVEIQADGNKATFFYTADERVDFRVLIRELAQTFSLRVEMKQIGIRQEAAKVGGIGSCGRELCCSTWLSNFSSVSTSAARYQNLSINQLKLSGQCGRLKCCLNFELDTYMEALEDFPRNADKLKTAAGTAFLVKTDIFKNLMWYVYKDQSRHIPVDIEQVNEILELNRQNKLGRDLIAFEIEIEEKENIQDSADYVDVVGQISLSTLDRKNRKRRNKNSNRRKANNSRRPGNPKNRSGSNNQNRNQRPKKNTNRKPNPNKSKPNSKPNSKS